MTLENFIKDTIDLIDDPTYENISQLYMIAKQYGALGEDTYKLTELLEKIDLDPLKILDFVPENYMRKSNVEEIHIPKGIMHIEKSAYRDCRNLRKVDIPDTVEVIANYAFENCTNLRYAIVRGEDTKIRSSVFENCPYIRIHCSRANDHLRGIAHVMGWPIFFID